MIEGGRTGKNEKVRKLPRAQNINVRGKAADMQTGRITPCPVLILVLVLKASTVTAVGIRQRLSIRVQSV